MSRQTRKVNALIDGLMTTAQVKTRELSREPSAAVDATRFGPHATESQSAAQQRITTIV